MTADELERLVKRIERLQGYDIEVRREMVEVDGPNNVAAALNLPPTETFVTQSSRGVLIPRSAVLRAIRTLRVHRLVRSRPAEAWTPEEILQIAAQTPGMEVRRS